MTAVPRLCALLASMAVLSLAGAAAPRVERTSPALAHLDLEVELEPASRRLRAIARFTATGESAFTLHRSLTVLAASADGRPLGVTPVDGEDDTRTWRVSAPRGAALRIEYGGTLPALDRTLDHRRVLRARAPMSAVEGSFLQSESGWYPRPAAHFTYRVKLSLPGDQRGLVAGHLAAEKLPADINANYECVFEFKHPAEGIDLMAGPYIVREKLVPRRGAPPLRLRTYFFNSLDALAEGYLRDSQRYIDLYSREIGDYPFTEFSVVASPLPTGFGMPTLTYIGADVLKLPFIRATSLGHEVLHNWWGNGVYVDYAKGNWSEGLTTFMADYFYKERQAAAAAQEMRLSWLRDFAAVPAGSHQPLSAFRSRTHGAEAAVGYGKAAMVFFMLRDAIGEDAFRRGIRQFWAHHRFRVASWDDLRAALEQASGKPLEVFFEQWVQRAGGPTLAVAEARSRTDNGKTTLALTLTQPAPAYALRVPVELVAGSRSETRRVEVDRERNFATLTLDAAPEGVRLDPEFRLWRRLEPEALPPILRQWIIARAPRLSVVSTAADVQLAAQALAQRLFEAPARMVDSTEAKRGSEPLLIAGLHADIDRALSASGLPSRPAALANRGSAQVWTIQHGGSAPPIAVVSARDAEALAAIARPLPHYGGQSYLAFDDGRVIERGVWPAQVPLVPVKRSR
ncbi:MAG: M1 family peptidase [Betaproteobacteria bacterium]|nr:M1 family peptidase [Betaproteobacteria bacterium]